MQIRFPMRFGMIALAAALGLTAVAPTRAAEEDQPDEPQTTVDASKGGYTIRSGNNSVTFGTYVQLRALVEDRELFDADTDPDAKGFGEEDGPVTSFDVARARLSLKGTMFREWLRYVVTYELARTPGEGDSKFKDVYLEFAGSPLATFRIGQYKVPFSLQELVGDQYQQFVDRSITNAFAPARDAGVQVSGVSASKRLGYAVGLFNGSGESRRQEDEALLRAARIWFDPFGEYKLQEGSNENPDRGVLHVGLGYRGGEAHRRGTPGVFEDPNDQTALNLEVGWKYRRFFATGEYTTESTELDNPTDATGPDVDADGWHVQGGFMVVPERLEVGLRYAAVDPDDDLDDDGVTELRAGVNYFWNNHHLKLQLDLGEVSFEANGPTALRLDRLPEAAGREVSDTVGRVQFQLFF